MDLANRAIDQAGNLSKDEIIEKGERIKNILSSHVYRPGVPENIRVTYDQLAVIKLFMSDDIVASRRTEHTCGGVIKPGYFRWGGNMQTSSLGGNHQIMFYGSTSRHYNF